MEGTASVTQIIRDDEKNLLNSFLCAGKVSFGLGTKLSGSNNGLEFYLKN